MLGAVMEQRTLTYTGGASLAVATRRKLHPQGGIRRSYRNRHFLTSGSMRMGVPVIQSVEMRNCGHLPDEAAVFLRPGHPIPRKVGKRRRNNVIIGSHWKFGRHTRRSVAL